MSSSTKRQNLKQNRKRTAHEIRLEKEDDVVLNSTIQKDFGGDLFEGEVVSRRYDVSEGGYLYRVLYSDGDSEELNVQELYDLVSDKKIKEYLKNLSGQPEQQQQQQQQRKFDPDLLINTTFQKDFKEFGVFTGKIISHRVDEEEGVLFKAQYPDGDEEELNPSELFLLLPTTSDKKHILVSVLLPPLDRNSLPDGWLIHTRKRKGGRVDSYFESPSGDILRSMPDVNRYLGRRTRKGSSFRRPRIQGRLDRSVKRKKSDDDDDDDDDDTTKNKKRKGIVDENFFEENKYDIIARKYIVDLDTKDWIACSVYSLKGSEFRENEDISNETKPVVLYLESTDEYEGLMKPYWIDRHGVLYDADGDKIESKDENELVCSNCFKTFDSKVTYMSHFESKECFDHHVTKKTQKVKNKKKTKEANKNLDKFKTWRKMQCMYCKTQRKYFVIESPSNSNSNNTVVEKKTIPHVSGRVTCMSLRYPNILAVGTAPREKRLILGGRVPLQAEEGNIWLFVVSQDQLGALSFTNIIVLRHDDAGLVWDMHWEPFGDERLAVCLGNYTVKILSFSLNNEKSALNRSSVLTHNGLRLNLVRWSSGLPCHLLTGTLEGCVVLWYLPRDSDRQFSNIPLCVFGTWVSCVCVRHTHKTSISVSLYEQSLQNKIHIHTYKHTPTHPPIHPHTRTYRYCHERHGIEFSSMP